MGELQGEEFGQNRVKEVIRSNCKRSATTIIAELYAALVKLAGSTPQHDDLTVLIVKRI